MIELAILLFPFLLGCLAGITFCRLKAKQIVVREMEKLSREDK